MSSLEERLKKIRQTTISPSKQAARHAVSSKSNDLPSQDDVHALIRQTADELAVDSQAKGATDHDEDLEAWLGYDSEEEGQCQSDKLITKKELRDVTEESDQMTRDAERALQELRQDELFTKSTVLLQLEPKTQPVLSRKSSDESQANDEHVLRDTLEDDLAEAMAGELGTRERGAESNIRPQKGGEVDELSSRLAQLRANDRLHGGKQDEPFQLAPPTEARNDPASFLFDLPSAPRTQPIHGKTDESDLDWRKKHGVQGRELSSYEALVRLNATTLGAPSSKPKALVGNRAEEADETDDWCCICNEDARVQCLGCDQDLYCQNCWNEGHLEMDQDELAEHVAKIFAGHRRKPVAAA